ncbi:large subunit ribosomal protein L13e [Nematocida displodere]|uniref:60S ribosomal protein L13 n=1 Tax=Nematocida displodere TaxID=1805483 RepID=A0A177ECP8_9MICR|nr:large subunit ribosomal protein L13e [Nematocida displodere]
MKHNNALSTGHFKKSSLKYKLWFDQPIQKKIRRERRQEKAKKISPRNVEMLKPAVRCLSNRYNTKMRLGRGFSFAEVLGAGLTANKARRLGIAVDPRRHNYSEEGVQRNIERIKEYLAKTTVYKNVAEAKTAEAVQHKSVILPLSKARPQIEGVPRSEVKSEVGTAEKMVSLRNECIKKRSLKARSGLLAKMGIEA